MDTGSQPRRVLITGGAGFIGSRLVAAHIERGDEVTVVDDLSSGSRDALAASLARGARLKRVDVTDAPALRAAVNAARPQLVVHLAAQTDVGRSLAQSAHDARVNVEGTVNVLEAAVAAGAQRLVLSSTAAVYGDEGPLPLREDGHPAPASGYGQSKLSAEGYCALYGRLYGLSTLCLRFANVYGPGEERSSESGVVTLLCAAATEGRSLTLFGDGRQTRDFVYVDDVVDALLAGGDATAEGVCNVSTGREVALLELVDQLRALAPGLTTARAATRVGDVRRSALDPGRAAAELGWQANTTLARGLATTLEHTRARLGADAAATARTRPRLSIPPRARAIAAAIGVATLQALVASLVALAALVSIATHAPIGHAALVVADVPVETVQMLDDRPGVLLTLTLIAALAVVAQRSASARQQARRKEDHV